MKNVATSKGQPDDIPSSSERSTLHHVLSRALQFRVWYGERENVRRQRHGDFPTQHAQRRRDCAGALGPSWAEACSRFAAIQNGRRTCSFVRRTKRFVCNAVVLNPRSYLRSISPPTNTATGNRSASGAVALLLLLAYPQSYCYVGDFVSSLVDCHWANPSKSTTYLHY